MSHAPTLVTRGTRALGKVLFLDCPLKWNVPEEIPKACVQFLLPSLSLSPGHIPIPATLLCGGYFNHRWGRNLEVGTASPGNMESRGLFKAPPAQRLHILWVQ